MFATKAYISATGKPKAYVLTHDVKKCVASCGSPSGWVHVVSMAGTTAVGLFENDPQILEPLLVKAAEMIPSDESKSTGRRSGLGGPEWHQRAALFQSQLMIPFENGKLLTSVHQDVMALDYEPKQGRREFLLSVIPAPAGEEK